MDLHEETHEGLDISTGGEVLTYTYEGTAPKSVLGRIELDGIAGGDTYQLRVFVNGRRMLPDSIVGVDVGVTSGVLQSRELLLRDGDAMLVVVDGDASDTDVDVTGRLVDMTPLTSAQAFGGGEVEVDHDYGGTDALRVTTSAGVGIAGASIQCYLAEDYQLGHRSADYTIAATHTGSDGRWINSLMLTAGEYVLRVYKPGIYAPAAVELVIA